MARSQNNERNPDAAWRSRYSDLPSVDQVLSEQHRRVARRRPRVNPAERPPEPPKRTSKSDDEAPKSTSKADDDKRKAKTGSRKAGNRKAKAGSPVAATRDARHR